MTSGVLQWPVLGFLFVFLDVHVDGLIRKFAEDTKIDGDTNSVEVCQRVQHDIDIGREIAGGFWSEQVWWVALWEVESKEQDP